MEGLSALRKPWSNNGLQRLTGVNSRHAPALASELIYGRKASLRDLAHGGKDGTPFPVDRATDDKTIDVMQRALNAARVDRGEKVAAFRRLSEFSGTAQRRM